MDIQIRKEITQALLKKKVIFKICKILIAYEEKTSDSNSQKTEELKWTPSKLITSYIKRYKTLIPLGILFLVIGSVGMFLAPIYLGWIIDALTKREFSKIGWLVG